MNVTAFVHGAVGQRRPPAGLSRLTCVRKAAWKAALRVIAGCGFPSGPLLVLSFQVQPVEESMVPRDADGEGAADDEAGGRPVPEEAVDVEVTGEQGL